MGKPFRHALPRCGISTLAWLTSAALLWGCGGGGGGGGAGSTSSNATSADVCVAAPASSASTPAAGAGGSGNTPWTVETGSARTYTELSGASDDTVNPMRGYHRWFNAELVPQASPALVAYSRYFWRDLESAPGVYDFSPIVASASAAKAAGRKFAFRIQMMRSYGDNTLYLPNYLYKNAACARQCGFWSPSETASARTFVPDWNDEWLQSRAKALLAALRDQLAPTGVELAWIDVGLYGQYGEWYLDSTLYHSAPAGIAPITESAKQAFVRMYMDVYAKEQLVLFALRAQKDVLSWALAQNITSKPLGLRVDCLGRDWVLGEWERNPADFALIRDQWKKAPFVAELCAPDAGKNVVDIDLARSQVKDYHISTIASGNIANSVADKSQRWSALTAEEQSGMLMMGRKAGYRYAVNDSSVSVNGDGSLRIRASIRNAGNAPSYENWAVMAELVDSAGNVAASVPMGIDLRSSVGACSAQYADVVFNPALPAGTRYTLRLVARSASWPALKWASAERNSDGSLTLATLLRNN